MRYYRAWLLACVAAWFMLGLHVPAIHQMTHHNQRMSTTVLGALMLLAVIGTAGLWQLLRMPAPGSASAGTTNRATHGDHTT